MVGDHERALRTKQGEAEIKSPKNQKVKPARPIGENGNLAKHRMPELGVGDTSEF